MATADEYAAWIVKNQSLRGTPEFDTVAKAYQEAKSVITTPTTTPTAPARPERTWGQALGDFGVQLGEGANTLVGAIPGLIAPESGATKFFERGAEYWREKQSEPLKQRMAAADVSIQKAGEEGIISQIVEAASQYYDDPALAARFVVTNLPSMIPGLGATKLAQAAALAKGATAAKAAGVATTTGGAVNAILNAGGARAEAFQDIQKTLIEQGYSPAEAEKKAIEDSRLVAAVGGVTGFISGKTGLEKAIAGGVTKGGVRAGAGRVAGELAGEQIEEVAPKFATNVQAAEYDARSLGKDIGRTIVETGIASGPGAALSGVMGGARPEVPPTAPAITPTGGAPTPPAAGPEVQEVRDRLAARGFSEEDIDRILAERAKREAPAAPPTAETPAEAAKEPTDVTATTLPADVPAVTEAQPGVGEPSVGVPSGDLGRPTTAEPAAPVGRGLERPVTPPAPRVETEAPIPTELTETPRGTQALETIQAKEEGSAQPAAPAPTAVEAPASTPPVTTPKAAASTPTEPKVTFKTALGSSYSAFPDGTTQRVKAERNLPGHEGDKGSKERSVRTVYLDSEASALSAAGVTYPEGAKPRVVLKDGTATLTWIVNGKRGSAKAGTKVPFYTEPAVGRFPLELWQPRKDVPGYEAYAGTHAGNQIVEVSTPAATPPVEEKPARYQRLRAEQPWYSALSKAIEESPQKAAPAPQWKNVLTGMVNKGQAKRDEIEWTGVEDWLALQQGRVTKEQVQDYLKQGGVKVEETVLGTRNFTPAEKQELQDLNERYRLSEAGEEVEFSANDFNRLQSLEEGGEGTKYSTYTLPGGENYREVLLTLPRKKKDVGGGFMMPVGDAYQSSHWDQPNVLAHIRVNDRTDADGKKVLFVEEIQSDWGQEGKKKGFAGKQSAEKVYQDYLEALQSRVADDVKRTMMGEGVAEEKATALGQKMASRMAQDSRKLAEYLGESDKQMALNEARIKERSAVPAAPFVTKTEGWLNLALKRVLTMAAEGGYDRVAFTTGDQNAQRYSLENQVDQIDYFKRDDGQYDIEVRRVGEREMNPIGPAYTAEKLADVVGKEVADRIINDRGEEIQGGWKRLTGLDLKVGGEGMKTFYDQIIPNALKKLLPKVGGGKIEEVPLILEKSNWDSLSDEERYEAASEYAYDPEALENVKAKKTDMVWQPGFDITPAMREKLAGGLPLFQKEGKEQPPQKTGKYPLPAQAIEDLKDNNLALALEAIETSKPSEINKAIAARLKVLLKNTKVTIADDLRDSKGNPVLGAASTSGSRIWLDVNRGMNMETVLHESVHAATERILSTPENQRTPQQNAAVQELTDLWNAAKTNGVINLTPEASDSLSEFVAEGMTNIELQDQLASVKWESRTMWAGFKRILLNMLGIKTPASMLDYTLASVDTIFAAVPKAAPTATPAQPTTKPVPKAKQTETKAFKDWFGDSKVVDENGEPLVVYHGSPVRDFTVFDINKINANDPDGPFNGFFFSSSKQDADSAGRFPWGRPNAESPQTRAFYLSIKNPATKKQARAISREIEDAYFNGAYPNARSLQDATREELEKRGYDGIVFEPYVSPSREAFERDGRVKLGKNGGELVRTEEGYVDLYERGEQITGYADFDEALNSLKHGIFIAFRPEQIKSAIGNRGTFDVKNADIRYQKPKLTAEEKAKKEAEEADAKVTEAMRKFAESKTSEEAAKAASTLQSLRSSTTAIPQLRRLYDSVSNLGRRRLVQVLPIDFLVELASKNVPELKTTTNLLGRMSGMREQLLHGTSQTSDRISRAFKKDPLLRGRLEEVVYASTLAQIDPSTNKISEKLNTLYKALGEEGQTIYKEVRDYYTDMGDLYSQLIKSNVERSEASEESKAAILAKLKVMFEPANRMRPYFPLMREGNYWFSSGKGKNRRFHMFETMPERDAALEAFARSEGKSLESMKETSEVKFGNNVASLREISKDTDQSLTDVLALVGKLDTGSAASKQELLDSVYQMYLNSLPEQSFRKHYITREGVAGFRTDFLRNFSQSAIQMSGQLARVKYGPQIRASLSGAKASIENQPQYEPYVEEMTKRAERDLVPPARTSLDAISDVLTKWTYIHYLSSVSSALLQPVGILQTALPVLGGRYGYGKTAAEVAKLAKVWDSFSTTRNLPDGTTTTVFPTVANSKAVNASPLEKQAIKEMLARDVSQSTMARELYGYRAKPTDRVNTKLDKGIKGANFLMGGLMHHTERIAREIVFLASYRLNIEAGKSHEAAVDAAVKDTQDSLGNYSQYARPLIMRNPGGKIVLQFSTYPLHIASFLANNFYKMIPILNKEGKAEAAKIFFGTLGTTWILAGAAGFPAPVSAVLMGFISFMFSKLSDDEEMPDEMRKQDFTKWFNEIWLPSQLGHIEVFGHKLSDIVKTGVVNVAGWDFASRTGLNNLFLREQKETKTPREGLQAAIIDKAGPSINMMLSYADGVQAFKEGDYQRAVEKVAPAAVRSVAQTYKFVTEGAKDIKGNELITKGDFTTGELIGRSIGFQPSRLANLQKVNAEVNQDKAKRANERNLLLRRLDIADRKKSDLGEKQFQTVLKDINTYNAKYPTDPITPDSLFEFLEGTQEERAKSLQGVTITEKTPVDVVKMIELSRTKQD